MTDYVNLIEQARAAARVLRERQMFSVAALCLDALADAVERLTAERDEAQADAQRGWITAGERSDALSAMQFRAEAAEADRDRLAAAHEKARTLLMLAYREQSDWRNNSWFIAVEKLFPDEFAREALAAVEKP